MRGRVVGYGLTVAALTGALVASGGMAAGVQPAFICPDGYGWVKVDGPFGQTVFAPAPDGQLIVEVCYKAGTNSSTYSVEPVEGVSITSTLVNNGGQVADISHYSIRLVPVVTPTPEPTVTSTPTPEPTRTLDPSPEPTLIPPIAVVPDEPALAPTGVEGWFWIVLAVTSVTTLFGAGMFAFSGFITNLAKRRSVRSSHDSTTTGEQ